MVTGIDDAKALVEFKNQTDEKRKRNGRVGKIITDINHILTFSKMERTICHRCVCICARFGQIAANTPDLTLFVV